MSTLKLSDLDRDIYEEMRTFLAKKDHGFLVNDMITRCFLLGIPPQGACMVMAEFINAFCICASTSDSDLNEPLKGLKALHQDQITNLINDWKDYRWGGRKSE